MTPEEKKAYMKEWRQNNKERIYETNKIWRENNKEKLHKKAKEYRENNNEKVKKWRQTPSRIKSNTISKWKHRGVIHDDWDALYEAYLQATNCEVCKNEFKNSYDRCLDHCHQTGLFRQFLCRACNRNDRWLKHQT